MDYRVSLEKGRDGHYVARCLEIPGAISQGRTETEALKNVEEAIRLLLEVREQEAKNGEIVKVTLR